MYANIDSCHVEGTGFRLTGSCYDVWLGRWVGSITLLSVREGTNPVCFKHSHSSHSNTHTHAQTHIRTDTQVQQTDWLKQSLHSHSLHRDNGLLMTYSLFSVSLSQNISAVLVTLSESHRDMQMTHTIIIFWIFWTPSSDFSGVTLENPQSLAVVRTIRCAAAPLSINKQWGAY